MSSQPGFAEAAGLGGGGTHARRYPCGSRAHPRGLTLMTYDWSGVNDPKFEALFPLVSQEHLERTLERIAEVVG